MKFHLIQRLALLGAALFLTQSGAQGVPKPDLSVTKVCVVNGPQSVLCTVTIKNIGQSPSVSPLMLTDTPTAPAGSTYTGAGSNTGLPVSCSLGAGPVLPIPCTANKSMQPGESADVLFSFKVPSGGQFKNCVTVTTGSNPGTPSDPNPANNTNICTTVNVPGGGGGGPITIVTPPPTGACTNQVVVSGLHYPSQNCAQSTPNFLSTLSTSFHFKSKCIAPNQLLGVTNASCQNAPIPGFPTGSVYQGTACCGAAPASTATLTLVKKVSQPPSTQAFNFTMTGPGLTGAVLDDDGSNGNPLSNSKTFGNVAAGVPLTITEGAVSGWTLSSIVCTPASGGITVNLPTRTLTANLAPGANVTCTFTNSLTTGNGKLTVKKVLVPATDPGKFTLAISTSSGTLLGNFLNGGNGATAGPMTVPAGNYVVSETAGSASPTTLAQYTRVISGAGCAANGDVTIAPGDNKVCTITNTRITAPWPNTATVNIFNPMTPFGPQTVHINAGGTVTFNNVNSGANWTITWFSGPATFPPIPLPNNATGITVPLTVPGAYQYVISGTPSFTVHGNIVVH